MRPKNIGLILVSLSMSLGLWLYVQSQQALLETRTEVFSLEVRGLNKQEFIVDESRVPKKIDVQVSGLPEELDKLESYKPEQFEAILDLSDAKAGLNSYEVRLRYPEGLRLDWDAPEVTVDINPRERREFEVQASDAINAPPGQALAEVDIRPSRVTVAGSPADLNRIAQVVLASQIDLSSWTPGSSAPMSLQARDANEKAIPTVDISPAEVLVTPTVRNRSEVKKLLVILEWGTPLPAELRVKPGSVRFEPSQVTATATNDISDLESYDTISTQKIDLGRIAQSGEHRLSVRLATLKGVRLRPEVVTVRFEVERNPISSPTNSPPTNDGNTASTGG